jgi:hypothetical protein
MVKIIFTEVKAGAGDLVPQLIGLRDASMFCLHMHAENCIRLADAFNKVNRGDRPPGRYGYWYTAEFGCATINDNVQIQCFGRQVA